MKPARILRLFLSVMVLLVFVMPVISHASDSKIPDLSRLFDRRNADRILLVGFKDKSINRIPATATAYRHRGHYQSSTWSQAVTGQIAKDYHLQKLTEWPMTEVDVHCVVYQVPVTLSVADIRQSLARDVRVEIVQNLNLFTTKANSKNDPYFELQSNLQAMQIDQVHDKTTGKNVTIAMIDTGADIQHPDLAGQITRNENFAQSISPGFINDKHGTAVAGIMVAKMDNGAGIIGIAPDANLIALKACWPDTDDAIEAVCNSFTLALAVNNAIQSGAKILNMSLTGPRDPLLELLLNKAISEGRIVVAADAGPSHANENFPAALSNVISVQSLRQADSDHEKLAQSITAPGEKILTTLPHGTYDFISGSSIAAAEVSGIIALLLELKPDLTSAEAKSILQKSALPTKTGGFQGVNANSAVLALCETTGCPRLVLSFSLKNQLKTQASMQRLGMLSL